MSCERRGREPFGGAGGTPADRQAPAAAVGRVSRSERPARVPPLAPRSLGRTIVNVVREERTRTLWGCGGYPRRQTSAGRGRRPRLAKRAAGTSPSSRTRALVRRGLRRRRETGGPEAGSTPRGPAGTERRSRSERNASGAAAP